MPSIRLDRVTFTRHASIPLFEEVSFTLSPGWTGVVGANGSGKSTLLALVRGELSPTAGTLRLEPSAGDARLGWCPQTLDHPGAAVLALRDRDDRMARRWRGRFDVDEAGLARWTTLSPGERRRWQLAAALADEPDILLLDEPENHVDAGTREQLTRALQGFRGVGLLVSHDRALLDALTTQTLRLHRGHVSLYPAPYGAARALWEAEREGEVTERARLASRVEQAEARLADARRERAAADRQRSSSVRMKDANDHDARGLCAKYRAVTAEKRAGRTVGTRRAEVDRARADLDEAPFQKEHGAAVEAAFRPSKRAVLASVLGELRQGDRVVLRDLSVAVRRDTRARLTGPNGAGKSTLLAALGASVPAGEEALFLPQELSPGEGERRLEQLRALPPDTRGKVLQIVAALGLDPAALLRSAHPSPGEARKLVLASAIGRGAVALFLDEPENHLDLPSIERLEEALHRFPGALVIVSHDPTFATQALTSTWNLEAPTDPRPHATAARHLRVE